MRQSVPRNCLTHTLKRDLQISRPGVLAAPDLLIRFCTVRGLATLLFRVSQAAGRISPLLGLTVKQINHVLTGADLAWQASVGDGLRLYHPTGVVIGPDVVLGSDCSVQGNVTLGAARERGKMYGSRVDSPRVGNDARISAGAVIVGPIELGDRVTVGANAVVLCDAPSDSLAIGVPAKVRMHERA